MANYPDNMKITLPEPYLTAIGKVCVQWAMLEAIVDLSLRKLMGYELFDPKAAIITAHMTWPLKMDVLASLVASLRENYPHLKRFDAVKPMLAKAQAGRNRIVHASWTYEEGIVRILRATARGQLKTSMAPVTIKEIEQIVDEIGAAAAALLKMVLNK